MRRWSPPSFDGASRSGDKAPQVATVSQTADWPTVDQLQSDLQALRMQAHQEGFAKGLQEGLAEGQAQGQALGRQEGFELGRDAGFEAGFQKGMQTGAQRVAELTSSMERVLATLEQAPQALQEDLAQWVYETASRLSGHEQLQRGPFVAAVQEALMRLPRPGEDLFVRIPPQEEESWKHLVGDAALPFQCTLVADPTVAAGHAYVEAGGTRIDVGREARDALVRSALGLLRPTP